MTKPFVKENISIKIALKKLSSIGSKCLIIINNKKRLLGTLSDGDLRRSIINGKDLNSSIKQLYNSSPIYLNKKNYNISHVKKIFINKKIDIIPIVDENHNVVDVLTWSKIFKRNINSLNKLNNTVVIMAGGKGTRLEPFTKILPKPLIPIQDKPIIEHIIEKFCKHKIKDFYLTINYKSRILKAFYEELKPSYNIDFINEKKPLGTASSLKFISKFKKPVFVTNCDILLKADYHDIYQHHMQFKNDITLVVSAKDFTMPYGSCILNKSGSLASISEKPTFNFLVNTGFYIINPNCAKLIPKNKYYDFTNLISDLIIKEKRIGIYPVDDGSWLDFGHWSEFHKAIDQL